MHSRKIHEKKESRRQSRRIKGLKLLLAAVGCFVISYMMHASGVEGGVIFALISLAWLICFIGGLICLIVGLVGRE